MPALRGSLTYARFFVEGTVPDDFSSRFMKAVRLRAMKPLEPDEEELERSGWAKIGEPFVIDLSSEDVFFNEYVALGFRTDRWAISPAVLRRQICNLCLQLLSLISLFSFPGGLIDSFNAQFRLGRVKAVWVLCQKRL